LFAHKAGVNMLSALPRTVNSLPMNYSAQLRCCEVNMFFLLSDICRLTLCIAASLFSKFITTQFFCSLIYLPVPQDISVIIYQW